MSDRFEIELTRKAERDLDDLKQNRDKVVRKLDRLRDDPQSGHTLAGSLRGTRSLEFNLKGSGAYRAVYTIIDRERLCIVFVVGPHENIYRVAERRYAAWLKTLE